jgi:hypothetical protein
VPLSPSGLIFPSTVPLVAELGNALVVSTSGEFCTQVCTLLTPSPSAFVATIRAQYVLDRLSPVRVSLTS